MPLLVPPPIPQGGLRRHDQPTLTVDELVVRPWGSSDVDGVVSAYRDPDIQRWHVRTMTDAEALDWVQCWSHRWSAETGAGWAIVDAGVLVGRVSFRLLNLGDGYGEASYWVIPAARGRGVAARALAAVTDWMFELVGFHRMHLHHSTRNSASCRVAEKAGYSYEGTLREQALHTDGWHDMHLHARINPTQ
ncbi:MAG: GNAT family N-acetyltransferase [Mycobacteriales bacterium]